MLGRIFPKQYDNTYDGWRLATALLALIVALRLAQGISIMADPVATAMGADRIPVASYAPQAAAAVVLLFTLLGFSLVLTALIGVVAMIRYRAMIPLVYILLLVQALGSRAIVALHPIVRGGSAMMVGPLSFGTAINLATYAVMIAGFILSVLRRRDAA
ncbi:MAG TPA: hypothetical protein VMU01_01055 [Rhizomicrobium sp.]|nr:hypothetical protein [Rhizomicrobium sp.]